MATGPVLADDPRRAPNPIEKQSTQRIVYFDRDVKFWAEKAPSVGAARPGRCPACESPGARAGGSVGLVGHGLRERVVLGPAIASQAPEELTIQLRRYRCRSCKAVVTVAPRAVLYRMLYSGLAVAVALSLWVVAGLASWKVRSRVSPRFGAPSEREHGWRSVGRWARHAERWWRWLRLRPGDERVWARQIVQQLAGRAASARGSLLELACEGALRA